MVRARVSWSGTTGVMAVGASVVVACGVLFPTALPVRNQPSTRKGVSCPWNW